MFRVSIIALALSIAQDRDLPAVMAYDRIGHEDDGPDNVVLFLEVGALEDACGTGAFHKGCGYVSDDVERMVQIVDDFVKAHGRHHPVCDCLIIIVQDSKCSASSHVAYALVCINKKRIRFLPV